METETEAETVPRMWSGRTVFCLGNGPSLHPSDVNQCWGLNVIAVNDAIQLAPWAPVLFAADDTWWIARSGMPWFHGLKYTLGRAAARMYPSVKCLRNGGKTGLSTDPEKLCTGGNSGHAAINLAVLFGASRIILLGFDYQPRAGENPRKFVTWLERMQTLAQPLKELGIEVINCSRSSALTTFPWKPLEQL